MRNFTLKFSAFIAVVALLFTASATSSCKKDKTCHGTVHTTTSDGIPVGEATIKLYAAGGDVIYEGTTDGSGTATFEVKLPAILDVSANKTTPVLTGTGILRLDEAGKSDDITVKMY